jgi:hypothetical protein
MDTTTTTRQFTCTQTLVAHKAGVSFLQATPHWLVSASADRVLKVWALHVRLVLLFKL